MSSRLLQAHIEPQLRGYYFYASHKMPPEQAQKLPAYVISMQMQSLMQFGKVEAIKMEKPL